MVLIRSASLEVVLSSCAVIAGGKPVRAFVKIDHNAEPISKVGSERSLSIRATFCVPTSLCNASNAALALRTTKTELCSEARSTIHVSKVLTLELSPLPLLPSFAEAVFVASNRAILCN